MRARGKDIEKEGIQGKKMFWMLYFCNLSMTNERIGKSN